MLRDSRAAQQCSAAGTSPPGRQFCLSQLCHKVLQRRCPLLRGCSVQVAEVCDRVTPNAAIRPPSLGVLPVCHMNYLSPGFRERNKSMVKHSEKKERCRTHILNSHFPLCRTVRHQNISSKISRSVLNSLPGGLSDTTVQETLRQECLAETDIKDQLFSSGVAW